jgi:hypothetical protein
MDEPRVCIDVAGQAVVYRKFFERFTVRAIHGYQISYGGGVGGLSIPLNKWLYRSNGNIRADLTLLGHFHQRLDGNSFLVNGSLIGHSPYAEAFVFPFEPAQQTFFSVLARDGGCRGPTSPIFVVPDSRKNNEKVENVDAAR